MGADITSSDDKAPLTIRPAQLEGIAYRLPVASPRSRVPRLAGRTLRQRRYPRHRTRPGSRHRTHVGGDECRHYPSRRHDHTRAAPVAARSCDNSGRYSGAAFPLVAAAIVPHSEIVVTGIGRNPTDRHSRYSRHDGAEFSVTNEIETGGEPAADVACRFSELHSAAISGDVVVRAIDEFPILTVAATQAAGVTTVRDAAELRVKGS